MKGSDNGGENWRTAGDRDRFGTAGDRPLFAGGRRGGMLFTAGQIPIDPATGKLVVGDVTAQTERVMRNLEAVLAAAGSSVDQVVKTTCFLVDLADFPAFNEVYGRSFPSDPPARSTVQVAKLPMGALVEVECVALLP